MRRVPLLLLVVALFVSACGGGGDTASSADADPGNGEEAATQETSAGGSDDAETLSEFFGWGDGSDPAATEAEWRDQEVRIQESIRQCMAEQGFEYQPMLPPERGVVVDAGGESHEEWVEEHGFGVTTWFGNEEEFEDEGVAWEDPNQEMLDAMSEAERQAWYEALYGTEEEQMADTTVTIDEETGETIYYSTGFGAGCQGQAYEAEYGKSQELWEELNPAMEEMWQRIEADPRVVEANENWAACMQEAGYEVTTRNEMYETVYQDFQARLEEITGGNTYVDPFEGWTEEEINAFFEEKSQEEIDAFFEEAERAAMENVDMEAVRALQQEEIDMAVKDLECGKQMEEVYQEVSAEYESDFIAEHRETLEQIRELEQG